MMETTNTSEYWRKCTTCKKPIGFGQKYWVCSVSTCNRQRTGLVFCDVRCFDAHVPVLNHRDAGAFERKAPSREEERLQVQQQSQPRSQSALKTGPSEGRNQPSASSPRSAEEEILVVVSKVKAYVRSCSGMNTSDAIMDVLSDRIRTLLDQAIRRAEQDGRKTVLDRDLI